MLHICLVLLSVSVPASSLTLSLCVQAWHVESPPGRSAQPEAGRATGYEHSIHLVCRSIGGPGSSRGCGPCSGQATAAAAATGAGCLQPRLQYAPPSAEPALRGCFDMPAPELCKMKSNNENQGDLEGPQRSRITHTHRAHAAL